MKVLCVEGQLRERGNTENLAEAVRAALRVRGASVDSVALAGRKISDCNDCGGCAGDGDCVVDDDMRALYNKILEADALVLVSPVYMWNVTGILKCFLDRLYCVTTRLEGKRVGLALTAGGDAFDGADIAVDTVRRLADYTGMFMVEPLFRRADGAEGYKSWDRAALADDAAAFCDRLISEN